MINFEMQIEVELVTTISTVNCFPLTSHLFCSIEQLSAVT